MTKPKLKKKSPAAAAEAASKGLRDSAQQIWMAGIGAFERAQHEGGKLFENLVKEGANLEKKTRSFTTGKVDVARDAVETTVSQVKVKAHDTWDKLEKVFEDRVSRALQKLGVPAHKEMQALIDRVEELNRAVRKLDTRPEAAAVQRAAKRSASKAQRGAAQVAQASREFQSAAAKATRSVARKARKTVR